MSSLAVEAYCETFEELRKLRETRDKSTAAVEDVLEDQLEEQWNELTPDECREVERRYPDLKLLRIA